MSLMNNHDMPMTGILLPEVNKLSREDVFSEVERFLIDIKKFIPALELIGPLMEQDKIQSNQNVLKEMDSFYLNELQKTAPYILGEKQIMLEKGLRIHQRSLYFVARLHGKVVAAVRLTPPPFELTQLIQNTAGLESLNLNFAQNYLEYSRLMTDPQIPNRGMLVSPLLLMAGLVAFRDYQAGGLIGLCRRNRESFFKKFQLTRQHIGYFSIEGRSNGTPESEYTLVHGQADQIIQSILGQVIFFKRFYKEQRDPACH